MSIQPLNVPTNTTVGTLVGTLVGTPNKAIYQCFWVNVPTVPTCKHVSKDQNNAAASYRRDSIPVHCLPAMTCIFGGNSGNSGNKVQKTAEIQQISRSHSRSHMREMVGTRHIPKFIKRDMALDIMEYAP
jgi:hypothetical protein